VMNEGEMKGALNVDNEKGEIVKYGNENKMLSNGRI